MLGRTPSGRVGLNQRGKAGGSGLEMTPWSCLGDLGWGTAVGWREWRGSGGVREVEST